jgi:uncharacterized glyoxalase superfamily protein PhnB
MTQTITPYLLYADVAAALDFLHRAFGFEEVLRHAGDGGDVDHAEMRLGEGVIYLGGPGASYRNPAQLGAATVLVCVSVDDVDAAYERAKAAGAEITQEPADQPYGERRFSARDPEGHSWHISQPTGEVAPGDWGATLADG